MLSMNKKILIISTVIANILYLLWRVCFTIPMDTSRISLFLAWGLFFAELLGVFELCVYLYGASHVKIPQLPKVQEEKFPQVDYPQMTLKVL